MSVRGSTIRLMSAAAAQSAPAIGLPRSYLVWQGGAIVSQIGDAALYFALGWAASAHGAPAAAPGPARICALPLPVALLKPTTTGMIPTAPMAARAGPSRARCRRICTASKPSGGGTRG